MAFNALNASLNRRSFLSHSLMAGGALAVFHAHASGEEIPAATDEPLPVPASGEILVAFAVSSGATVIDFAGPWEVFQDVWYEADGRRRRPFKLTMVGPNTEPIRASGGMTIVPNYSYADAPQPHVIVVPAQSGSAELHAWLRSASTNAQVTMSVCTGAFHVAAAGLFDGVAATTHHDFYEAFAKRYPEIELIEGRRFVDNGRIASAGGLTSGFDMALHVVARYFGPAIAKQTADYMEYDHYTGSPIRTTS